MEGIFSLKNKKVLLSGGGGFLGPYFAEALLRAGAQVIAVGRGEVPSRNTLKSAKESKHLIWYRCDYYDDTATKACYADISDRHGPLDVVVNNAFDFSLKTGFNDPSGKLENATFEQLEASFEAGVYWAIRATQAFGYPMKEKGGGSIVNVCTMYSVIVPSPDLYEGTDKFNPPGYSMAKAGLLQFTRYAASFLGPEVRVNALSPGAFPNHKGDTFNAIQAHDPVLERLGKKILLKRMGRPNDLEGSLIYLSSDASSYVTGQNIIVDGGLTVT